MKQKNNSQMAVEGRLRRVEGRHNPLIRELRRAFSHGDLTPDGYFAVEGVRILEEAIRSGLRFHAVFFASSAETKAQRLLPQIGAHVDTLIVPDKIFAGAVPSETPQGVAALVKSKDWSIDSVLERAEAGPFVVIAGLQDPGNLGTILRSAEAFGVGGMLLGEGTVSPYNPKVVRGSAGSIFRVPLARVKLAQAVDSMRERGIRLLATSSHKGTRLDEAALEGKIGIFIGSEGAGLPRELAGKMDESVIIPHSERVESLNAGVAASIVLYEVSRQKQFHHRATETQRHERQ